ncbi:MAG: patatin-like phospholipase family protein [Bacteroidales bacterium]
MKRILSLDGGGIRGALTLGYLQKIENILRDRHKNIISPEKFRLYQYFDMIGGTSTGSIIAAALAIGLKVSEIKEKYFELGKEIFGEKYDWWNPLETFRYLKARYNHKPLENELKKVFGDILLGSDKILTALCVVSKRADTNSTWLFHNNPNGKFFNSELGQNKSMPLWEIVRSSTAAPTYFVPQLLNVGNDITGAFVDGGVSMANNPALELIKVAIMKGFGYQWPTGADQLLLISIGTGNAEYFSKTTEVTDNWVLSWATEIPSMLMSDASWNNQTILQWISNCPKGKMIDMEIGDLKNENLFKEPLLTYFRYNQILSVEELNKSGLCVFTDEDVKSLKEMSNAVNCSILYEIGQAAAEKDIGAIDFPPFFDLKK